MCWLWYIFKNNLIIIIKHPGDRSLKSYCKLLVVNSENYYLDRLIADVYEGNITFDVFITSIAMLSSFSITFLTMKNCKRVVFQSMRSGAVHHNGAQWCMRDFYFFFTLFPPPPPPPLQKIQKKNVVKDILRHVHLKYGCSYSRT